MTEKTILDACREPQTLDEWVVLEAHLSAVVLDIDTQLGMHKSGAFVRDAHWHPKALAKRGHTIKQLMSVRETVKRLRKAAQKDEAATAYRKREAQYLKQIEQANASARRAKSRAAALYDWVYNNHPGQREELHHLWSDCAPEQTAPKP